MDPRTYLEIQEAAAVRPSHRANHTYGDMRVQLSLGTRNDGAIVPQLEVEDEVSGEVVVRVDHTGEQLAALLAGRNLHLHGTLPTRPERLGKIMQTASTPVRYKHTVGDSLDFRAEEIRNDYLARGWQEVRIDRTNYGLNVVAHQWVEPQVTTDATA